jgi:hypothetical protein
MLVESRLSGSDYLDVALASGLLHATTENCRLGKVKIYRSTYRRLANATLTQHLIIAMPVRLSSYVRLLYVRA